MANVFDPELGGNQGAAREPRKATDPIVREGKPGRYMQYDNEAGAMILNLPEKFRKYKAELQEDLMDAFYGESGGGKDQHQTIDEWIAEWIARKEAEDPELRREAE
ncbi:MAG: hypothetical protein AB7N76_01460 [Planctomycetota bacterium]